MADESGPSPVVYQVPMTYRAAPLLGAEGALIGTTEHGVLGTRWVYDAPHDDVFVDQLLALIQGQAEPQAQSESNTPDPTVAGHAVDAEVVTLGDVGRHAWRAVRTPRSSARSSTPPVPRRNRSSSRCSGRCTPARTPTSSSSPRSPRRGRPRSRTPSATSPASGPTRSPANGFADTWPSPSGSSRESRTRGGWRSGPATAGEDFSEAARELGAATAHIHLSLASALGTVPAADDAKARAGPDHPLPLRRGCR